MEHKTRRVASPPNKPLMVFDGDCDFCRRWVSRWCMATGARVEYKASQDLSGRFPEIPPDYFKSAVQLVETDGGVLSGADAVFKSLSYAPGKSWTYRLYRIIPGFAWLSGFIYNFVARNRSFFSRL